MYVGRYLNRDQSHDSVRTRGCNTLCHAASKRVSNTDPDMHTYITEPLQSYTYQQMPRAVENLMHMHESRRTGLMHANMPITARRNNTNTYVHGEFIPLESIGSIYYIRHVVDQMIHPIRTPVWHSVTCPSLVRVCEHLWQGHACRCGEGVGVVSGEGIGHPQSRGRRQRTLQLQAIPVRACRTCLHDDDEGIISSSSSSRGQDS